MEFKSLRRSTAARVLGLTLLATLFGWLPPGPADAQVFKICGDVDDNDTVSVTDGVQVLRAAAELSSDCTAAICDVDVSGSITVTDGVIILRKAAGLPITENCIPHDGTIDQQVAHLIRHTQPLVSFVIPTIVQHRNETADNDYFCQNGDEGTYEVSYLDGQQDSSFSSCLLDNFLIDGDVESANRSPILTSFELVDVRGGGEELIDFDATDDSPLLAVNIEGGVKYSGRLDASPSFVFFDTGDFLLVLNSVQVPATGYPLNGSISFERNADGDDAVPDVRRIRIFYDGSNLARVEVMFANGDFKYYRFELLRMNFF
jgi:hypothetical protein